MNEKSSAGDSLPYARPSQKKNDDVDDRAAGRSFLSRGVVRLVIFLLVCVWATFRTRAPTSFDAIVSSYVETWDDNDNVCPQEPIEPDFGVSGHSSLLEALNEIYVSDKFEKKAIDLLGGAVRIPTENFDDMGEPTEDTRWGIFDEFHAYLLSSFPLVHSTLKLTKVNKYGLVYEWEGSDSSLKPILLMGHQDVVPVNNEVLDQWIHKPYSGDFDGEYLWGRGSTDDKSMLIALFASIETLLGQGFKPTRSIFLVSGFDEETGGARGANSIAKYLFEKYGEDYFALLLDEGAGRGTQFGAHFALPAIAEKGWQDIKISILTPGGHSSVPPPHTSIGILANAIVHLENHPQHPKLTRDSPIYGFLQCEGKWAPEMPHALKKVIEGSEKSEVLLKVLEHELLELDKKQSGFGGKGPIAAVLSTTQAVDLIRGGVKVNALPERAEATVNHRVATYSSIKENAERFKFYLAPIAAKYNLALDAYGNKSSQRENHTYSGTMVLSDPTGGHWLDPAPVTPTEGGPYKVLAKSIRQSWAATHDFEKEPIYVAPGIMGGNTDTRHFWNLTSHIFRYSHLAEDDAYNGAHTINEATRISATVEQVRFLTHFILNTDESTLL